jgi:hypothetical protein
MNLFNKITVFKLKYFKSQRHTNIYPEAGFYSRGIFYAKKDSGLDLMRIRCHQKVTNEETYFCSER